jgi:hypothetical protein
LSTACVWNRNIVINASVHQVLEARANSAAAEFSTTSGKISQSNSANAQNAGVLSGMFLAKLTLVAVCLSTPNN